MAVYAAQEFWGWFAGVILGMLTYDILKALCRNLWKKLR